MEIEILKEEKKKGKLSLLIKKSIPAFVNALRRTIMEEVPVMAIEDVEIRKNSSILYDEMIAHRLGLIPLKTDLKGYELPKSEADLEERNAKCTVVLTLKATGPCIVLASEMKSKDPKVVPVFPDVPITKLLKNQELELEVVAVLGKGKEHMKWAPGLVWYNYKPKITVNNKSSKFDEFKKKYPSQIFGKDGKIDKEKIIENNMVDVCSGVCDDIVKIEYDPTSFIFNIESWGQLSPKEILTEASKILESKFEDFAKSIKD
ncbi:DNA-directed RNA polymerase subunit D [Nanoarchaeota archaeon]